MAKFWLRSGELASSIGFAAHELNALHKLVMKHRAELLEAWHGYFGTERR